MVGATAVAGAREQAKRMHDRLAGMPPTEAVLDQMAVEIAGGDPTRRRAARDRQEPAPASAFYNVTLKNFATPWTNRDQTVFAPLNDYVATVIGMVRDDVPFNTVLSADILYTGQRRRRLPAIAANNDHYAGARDAARVNLQDRAAARRRSPRVTAFPPAATAGVITSRAASEAFFIAGTNRAMFRFTLMNHLCRDMEQVHDTSRPPDRIRQDVSRSPGGDSRVFLNNCIGCHSGMDPMAQAFAYYDYDETARAACVYTPGSRAAEVLQQQRTTSRRASSRRTTTGTTTGAKGQNALLGWVASLPGRGNGAKSLGQELARQRCVRAVPGREGVPARLLPRAGRRSRSRRRSSSMVSELQVERLQAEAACSPRPPCTAWATEGDGP